MNIATLEGGFADAPRDAAFAFRGLMRALARPGSIEVVEGAKPPSPLSVAAGSLILTLADGDTPIHLAGVSDTDAARGWIGFHTGASVVTPQKAVFAIGRWEDLLPLSSYAIGTPEYPDRSATLIVECDTLEQSGNRLTGPGIRESAALSLPDPDALVRNNALFPLGLDFYFTCGNQVAALPRSTRIG